MTPTIEEPRAGIDRTLFREMRAVEDDHWWFAGLWRLVAVSLARVTSPDRPLRVLDCGCGTGGVMARIRRDRPGWTIHGVDASAFALTFARQRRAGDLACALAERLPFADRTFDVVTCLDVLYVEGVDDRRAVAEIFRVLRAGGRAIVNVPAYEALRGAHDRACATRHRYTAREVVALLTSAGFVLERVSYWNTALLLPLVLWRVASRGGSRSDLRPMPAPLNALLTALVRAEAGVALRCGLPFGSSVFAVAVKR
jgi:SAM-dependent methyltransferase